MKKVERYINTGQVVRLVVIPESVNEDWKYKEAQPAQYFKLLGFIPIKMREARKEGMYYVFDDFPATEEFLSECEDTVVRGRVMYNKARLKFELSNQGVHRVYFDSDEEMYEEYEKIKDKHRDFVTKLYEY